jgi:hypothetical protein
VKGDPSQPGCQLTYVTQSDPKGWYLPSNVCAGIGLHKIFHVISQSLVLVLLAHQEQVFSDIFFPADLYRTKAFMMSSLLTRRNNVRMSSGTKHVANLP